MRDSTGLAVRGYRWRMTAFGVLGVLVLLVVARLVHVHDQYWEWRLSPSSSPPKIEVAGRDYRRASPVLSRDPGLARVARVADNEAVWAPAGDPRTPTVVVLQAPGGDIGYVLMGGP